MYNVGDIINLGNLKGEITEVKKDTTIGFQHESNREPKYTFIVKDVPESMLIPKKNGTDTKNNTAHKGKEKQCPEG